MIRLKHISLAFVAVSLTVPLAACSSSGATAVKPDKLDLAAAGPSAAQLRALYKQAVDAGQTSVVIYGPNEATYAPINKAFGKRFPGIKVTAQPYSGAQLESRLATEFSSGKHVADLIETTTYAYLGKGYYQAYTPPTAAGLDAKFREKTGAMWGVSGTLFGFSYNNTKIKAADAPKSWADLANPRWRGQITSGDPSSPSAASDMLIKLEATGTINDAWLRAVAANRLAVKSELELANTAVAQGAYAISMVNIYNYYAADKAKGAPLTFVYPKDGVMIEPNYYGVVRGAPHTAAAELFLSWLYTKEAQEAFVRVGSYPLMPGTDTGTDLPALSSLNVLNPPDPAAMEGLWTPGTAKLKRILGGSAAG